MIIFYLIKKILFVYSIHMEKNNNNLSTFVIFFLMDKRLLSLLFIVITDEKKILIKLPYKLEVALGSISLLA